MFSLIYASLTAYAIHKGVTIKELGSVVLLCIVADIIALGIIFN